MPRLAGCCSVAVTVDLQAKCLTSDPWQSYLPSLSSGCGVPPSAVGGYLQLMAHGSVPVLPETVAEATIWSQLPSDNLQEAVQDAAQ